MNFHAIVVLLVSRRRQVQLNYNNIMKCHFFIISLKLTICCNKNCNGEFHFEKMSINHKRKFSMNRTCGEFSLRSASFCVTKMAQFSHQSWEPENHCKSIACSQRGFSSCIAVKHYRLSSTKKSLII